jgi:TonB family protein
MIIRTISLQSIGRSLIKLLVIYSAACGFGLDYTYAQTTKDDVSTTKSQTKSSTKSSSQSSAKLQTKKQSSDDLNPSKEKETTGKGKITKLPALTTMTRAIYPPEALAKDLNARVILLLTIQADGHVSNVNIHQSTKSQYPFDDNAKKAALSFKFSPAEIDGKPATVQIPFEYAFNAQEEKAIQAQKTAPKGVITSPPELLKFVDAEYPAEAKAKEVTGTVILLLTLSKQGKVTKAEIATSSNSSYPFDEAARKASLKLTFKPAQIDNEPAGVQLKFKYDFKIDKKVIQKKQQSSRLTGVVLEKGTRDPMIGVEVKLLKRKQTTFTDAKGKFVFEDLKAGPLEIEISDETHYSLLDLQEIEQSEEVNLIYYLEANLKEDENTVTTTQRRAKKEVAKRVLLMDEIRKIPGTQGDALKVVQNLPGVARIPFGGGGLVVRGSNPGDSGSMINRHFIPLVFHFGGIRSIFPTELLESINFYPGNYGAEFGRFSGGIVDVRFRRPETKKWKARFEADVFDAGVLVQGPVSTNASIALAGRRSYIDAILPAVIPSGGGFDLVVAPRYYDYQALYDWKKGKHRIRLYFFGSDDELLFVLNEPSSTDPAIRGDFKNSTSLMRGYLAWDYKVTRRLTHHLSIASGQNNIFLGLGEALYFDNTVNVTTIRDELTWKASKKFTLKGGFEGEAYIGNISLKLPPARKEGQTERPPLSAQETKETSRAFEYYNPALWLEAQLKLSDDFLLIPGARLDYDTYLSDFAPDPRMNLRYIISRDRALLLPGEINPHPKGAPKGTIKAGVGRYSQRPSPDETDATFGNPDLLLEHSAHFSLGYEHQFTRVINLDVIGFYKHIYGAVSQIDDPILRYDNNGGGRVFGLEVLLKHKLNRRFFGWLSYTLMRSERKDSGDPDYRLFSLDQTHILTLIAQYKFSPQWEVGARYRYTTGNPSTPYTGAIYDSDADSYVPIPGLVNSERVPSFQQLDLRVDRKWVFDKWLFTLYFELQNTINRGNPEGVRYNYNFTDRRYITGLPIIPSLGIRGEL